MLPGTPVHTFDAIGDDDALARWILDRIDESPDRLAVITVPFDSEAAADEMEGHFTRAYEIAKAKRPDLGVRLLHPVHTGRPAPRGVVMQVHEHEWVGGHCVRGCGERRAVR